MNQRIRAARVLAKRGLLESFINPGYYVVLSAGMIAGYFLVSSFAQSIDSGGFNPSINPLYDLIGRSLEGFFGSTFLEQLFSEGPYLFAMILTLLPVFGFLVVTSVVKFATEKRAGVIELLSYGPVDGAAYFIAAMIRDLIVAFVAIATVLIFLLTTAVLNNMVFGSTAAIAAILVLFLTPAVLAYGVLTSSVTDNSGSAIVLFFVLMLFFLLIIMGSFAVAGGQVQDLARLFSRLLNWISPFFYFRLGMRGAGTGDYWLVLGGLLGLSVLSFLLLLASHLALRIKGVRG